MAGSSREGRWELALRVQAALSLAAKKEVDSRVYVFVSCLEDS
jgi:hypothetical protein